MFQKVFHSRILIILFAIILLAISPAYAKGLGVKAGLSFGKLEYDFGISTAGLNTEYRSGFVIGLFREYQVSPSNTIQAELLYIQKGTNLKPPKGFSESGSQDTLIGQYRMHMLSFSFLAKVIFPSKTYFMGGPRVDAKLYSVDDGAVGDVLDDKFKTIVLGLSVGIGQDLYFVTRQRLFVEGMYYYDIGSLYKRTSPVTYNSTLVTIKNKAFSFVIGVKF